MSKEFEPFAHVKPPGEFNSWECKNDDDELEVPPDPETLFQETCEQLKQEAAAQGYAEGMQQAQAELDEKRRELAQWLALLQKPVELVDEKLTQELIQTMIWLCEHCIGVELSVNPAKLKSLLQAVKKELPSLRGGKVLGLHPLDVDWLREHISDKEMPGIEQALYADESLQRGDFYLREDQGELDARLSVRLQALFAKHINKETLAQDE